MGRKTENTGFICANCNARVPPIAAGTIRNHCPHCLYSLHVDMAIGDRACGCRGLMQPMAILPNSKKGQQILHRCIICRFERKNILADDDDIDIVVKIMKNQL